MNTAANYMPILASVVLIWFASLVGIFGMFIKIERLNWLIGHLVSFAVGALLGGAFLHLIPQAFNHEVVGADTPLYIVAGIMLFFVLERFLHWHHEHHVEMGLEAVRPIVTMNIAPLRNEGGGSGEARNDSDSTGTRNDSGHAIPIAIPIAIVAPTE